MDSFTIIENFNVFPNILLCLSTCCVLLLINKLFLRHHGMIRYKRYHNSFLFCSCYSSFHTVVIAFDNRLRHIDFLDQNDARRDLPVFDEHKPVVKLSVLILLSLYDQRASPQFSRIQVHQTCYI